MDSLHDCPATPISARKLAVVKGLAVGWLWALSIDGLDRASTPTEITSSSFLDPLLIQMAANGGELQLCLTAG